jgi:hypothetical protein
MRKTRKIHGMPPDSQDEQSLHLNYSSSRPAALETDEVILWQGASVPMLAENLRGSVAAAEAKRDRYYFVTNRRLVEAEHGARFAVKDRPNEPPPVQISVRELGTRVATVVVDGFAVKYVEDWRGLCGEIASLPRKTNRRFMHRGVWTPRRRRSYSAVLKRAGTVMHVEEISDAGELPLLDGEKILWSGQPPRWKHFSLASLKRPVWTLLWLFAPIGITVARWLNPQSDRGLNWLISIPAGMWVVAAMYSVVIKPFLRASKRSRTKYFLSNIRGFVVEPRGRTRNTDIVFLDGMGATSKLSENPDGTGDVSVGRHLLFEGVQNPRGVHKLVMETIRAATGTFESVDRG